MPTTAQEAAIKAMTKNQQLVFAANGGIFTFPHLIREIPREEMEFEGDSVRFRDPDGNTAFFADTKLGGSLQDVRLFETQGYIIALRGAFFRYKQNHQANYSHPLLDRFLHYTLCFDNYGHLWGMHHNDMFIIINFNQS